MWRRDRARSWGILAAVVGFLFLAGRWAPVPECPECPECPLCPAHPACRACPPHQVQDCKAPTRRDMHALALRAYGFEAPIMDPEGRAKYGPKYAHLPMTFDDAAMRALYDNAIGPGSAHFRSPLTHDGWVTRAEAGILYALVRHWAPTRVVEIGSGDSTKVLLAALGPGARVTCIEPYRADEVPRAGATTLAVPLQEAPETLFTALEAGDLLFIDSSHVTVPYGDVIYEYLFLLPRLRSGVYVHVHDIFLPDDYPAVFMDELKNYTEQWLLALLLSNTAEWKVLWATHYMTTRHPELFHGIPLSPRDSSFFFVKL